MRSLSFVFVSVLVLSITGLAYAKGLVSGEIQAFVVSTQTDGTEKVVLAEETEPGQIMEYRIVFTNNGDSAVNGIKVVDPIPANTSFIGDSHSADVDAHFEVSIDGGKTFEAEPVMRAEKLDDGGEIMVIVPTEKYTHVRWLTDAELVSDGGKQIYSYRVSVQ